MSCGSTWRSTWRHPQPRQRQPRERERVGAAAMATGSSPVQTATPGTFPLGRVAGVAIRLHAGFPLLLFALCALGFRAGRLPLVAYVLGGGVGVLLHEVGHAVTAR